MRMVMLFVFVLGLASCTVKKRDGDSTTTTSLLDTPEGAAIEKLLGNYYEDMSKRDWPKYKTYFWENATITTAWKQPGDSAVSVDVTTIDDFIRETPAGPDSQPIFEEKMTDSKINVRGNLAEAWVDYHARFGSEGNISEWNGTDVFTFLRHDGEWKIVSLVFESEQ